MRKWIVLLIAMTLATLSCGGGRKVPRYVFFLTLDTTRADALNLEPGNTDTPNLAALAAGGRTYSQAFCLIPITLPSHLTMLYSLPPHMLKVYNNGQVQQIPRPSLAQLMQASGYHTAAAVSLGVLKKDFGAGKGFESYAENFRPNLWYRTAEEVTDDAIEAIDRFKDSKTFFWLHYSDPHEPYFPPHYSEKFHILVNGEEKFSALSIEQPRVNLDVMVEPGTTRVFMDTRIPEDFKRKDPVSIRYIFFQDFSAVPEEKGKSDISVRIPNGWVKTRNRKRDDYLSPHPRSRVEITNRGKKPRRVRVSFIHRMLEHPESRKWLYSREVQYMDSQIGRLLEAIRSRGMMDDSLFVIMGDHGEGMGEYRNHFGHIHYLNPVYTRVPLILSGPGVKPGSVSDSLVSTLDVAPTILDAAGYAIPEFMEGRSLLGPVKPGKLVLETYSPEAYFDAFSIVDPPWQIIHYPGRKKGKVEMIHLGNDPLGLSNIFNSMTDSKAKSSLYNAILKISRTLTASKGRVGRVDQKHEEILKSLGYL